MADVDTAYYKNKMSYGGYGDPGDPNAPNGARDATKRYQDLGAQQGAAPVIDQSQADRARGIQQDATSTLGAAAHGQAPSQAAILGQQMTQNALQAQMAAAASARGGALAQAAATRGAAANAASFEQQAAQQQMAARAAEMAQARGQYAQAAGAMRGQDLGVAQAQAQLQAQQNALNERRQEYFEGLGNDVAKTQLAANTAGQAESDQAWAQGRALTLQDEKNTWGRIKDVGGAILGGVGGAIGSIFSDQRAKTNIVPLSQPGGDYVLKGGGLDVMGTLAAMNQHTVDAVRHPSAPAAVPGVGLGAGIGRTMSAAGRGLMVSDDRAKLAAAWDEGHAAAVHNVAALARMPPEQLEKMSASSEYAPLASAVRSAKADAFDEGAAARAATPMAEANRSMAPSAYQYKPGFESPGQAPGEMNVGPMAQKMAADPVARTAVVQDENTGLLGIDKEKGLKLVMGGLADLQHQRDEDRAEIEALKKRTAKR